MKFKSRSNSIVFFGTFLLLLLALSFFNIYTAYRDAKSHTTINLKNNSFLISEWIKGGFRSSDYVLRDIIEHVQQHELVYPTTNLAKHKQRKAFLERKRATLDNAILIGLFDKHCVVTHSNAFDGFDASQREYCQKLQQQPQLASVVSNGIISNTGQLNVTQARRFSTSDQAFSGMAAISVNLKFFEQMLGSLNYDEQSIISIYDSQLTLLSRKPSASHLIGTKINSKILVDFVNTKALLTYVEGVFTADGIERRYVLRKVEQLPFIVVIGEANQHWQMHWRNRTITSLVSLLIILILAIVALQSYRSVSARKEQLKQLKTAAEKLARTDSLTGVPNRFALFEQGNCEFSRHQRYANTFSVMMLDIDHFKRVNDNFGHDVGDSVLSGLGELFNTCLRDTDTVGRIGGEEFVILLPQCNLDQANTLAERIRKNIEQHTFEAATAHLSITISIGLAQAGANTDSFPELLKLADNALYQAKHNGRNQVVSAHYQAPSEQAHSAKI